MTQFPPNIHQHGQRFRFQKKVNGRLIRRTFRTLREAESFLRRLVKPA